MKYGKSPRQALINFVIGLIMAVSGGYMLLTNIRVTTGFWGYRYGFGGFGVTPFGVLMIFLIIGILLTFFNPKSKIGWAIGGGSIFLIIVATLASLQVIFANTSLFATVGMFILLFGGIGLIARALNDVED